MIETTCKSRIANLFTSLKSSDKLYVWWLTEISVESISTSPTADVMTTGVSTGTSKSTFGNHLK